MHLESFARLREGEGNQKEWGFKQNIEIVRDTDGTLSVYNSNGTIEKGSEGYTVRDLVLVQYSEGRTHAVLRCYTALITGESSGGADPSVVEVPNLDGADPLSCLTHSHKAKQILLLGLGETVEIN